jgi:Na+-transporting methylmalonyl-CoA/oxaloacetate decarboxylase gamma subunit
MGAGIAGGVGGIMAATFGFKMVFIFVSVLTFLSTFMLLFVKNEVFPRDRAGMTVPAEKPVVEP